MASLDRDRALLAPVQPDSSGEKPVNRKMFTETDAVEGDDSIFSSGGAIMDALN